MLWEVSFEHLVPKSSGLDSVEFLLPALARFLFLYYLLLLFPYSVPRMEKVYPLTQSAYEKTHLTISMVHPDHPCTASLAVQSRYPVLDPPIYTPLYL
jgi:hypothetical protein